MDLPKGKTVWLFDQTDMVRAKETIGQVACIQGNVPLSLLHAGTIDQVVDYTRTSSTRRARVEATSSTWGRWRTMAGRRTCMP